MQKPRPKLVPGKIMWLPVMLAFFFDYMTSILVSVVGRGIDPILAQTPNSSWATPTGVVVWLLQILSTGVWGLVAARYVKHERVLHGFLVGGVGIFILLLESMLGSEITLNGLDLSLTFLATLLGGLGGFLSRWVPTPQETS